MRKQYGQIHDNKGNTIAASRDSRMLFDAGWRIAAIRHKGMYKEVWWYDLKDKEATETVPQSFAVMVQRERNKAKKGK